MVGQRARSDDDKRARRRGIVEAARVVFDAGEVDEFTMDAVAARLGLAKGTLYRYVPTREGLLLALTLDEYEQWFDLVGEGLEQLPAPAADEAVAELLVATLVASARFMRLLSMLASVLERNVPLDTATEFKTTIVERSGDLAARLASALGVDTTRALQLLYHLQAIVIGLYHHAHPAPVVQQLTETPELSVLRIDLAAELRHGVRALVTATH